MSSAGLHFSGGLFRYSQSIQVSYQVGCSEGATPSLQSLQTALANDLNPVLAEKLPDSGATVGRVVVCDLSFVLIALAGLVSNPGSKFACARS